MEFLTILVVIILGLTALLLIGYPLWKQTRVHSVFRVDRTGQTLEEYQARYNATLASIKDLMFDYEMGKVDEADYQLLLEKAKLEAAGIRQTMDRLQQTDTALLDAELDSEIERLVQETRQAGASAKSAFVGAANAEIERLKRESAAGLAAGCAHCGSPYQPGDAFCSHCGSPLPAPTAVLPSHQPTCPDCGSPVQPDDAFCTSCGFALASSGQITST